MLGNFIKVHICLVEFWSLVQFSQTAEYYMAYAAVDMKYKNLFCL